MSTLSLSLSLSLVLCLCLWHHHSLYEVATIGSPGVWGKSKQKVCKLADCFLFNLSTSPLTHHQIFKLQRYALLLKEGHLGKFKRSLVGLVSKWVSFCRVRVLAVSHHFVFLWKNLCVTKPDKISRYIKCVNWSWLIGSFRPKKNFCLPLQKKIKSCQHPSFNFWVKNRALVRPYLQSWTGFDLLIILGIKFWFNFI